ncbi:MAG: response regulator, partial [Alphaproteobacteria bacterium]|nr:response regulator [Alphaproteobacteria bacterium]
GIDPTIQERVFDLFFTTKERGCGTGLGLSVVHGIVLELGGTTTLRSPLGQGTTFDVWLPIHDGPATKADLIAVAEAPRGKGRILLVDDEAPIVRMGQKVLARLGYTVVGATVSEEALAALRATPHDFDLLITDQTMPGRTGDALIAEVRRVRPDLPIILSTGYSQAVGPDEAKRLGVTLFLMKPLESDELGRAVAEALARPT